MSLTALEKLNPHPKNPRRGNIPVIAKSLDYLGQYRPIVVNLGTLTNRPNEILAGNHTYLAAQQLGWTQIDCHFLDVDDETANRILAVDNKSNDLAVYDNEVLAEFLSGLPHLDATGWNEKELTDLLEELNLPTSNEPSAEIDELPEIPEAVTQPGDVWNLGDNRLLCGDSSDSELINLLFSDGAKADVMWTDPPYGVNYVGKTSSELTIKNDTADGLFDLLMEAFQAARGVLRPGAPVYVAHADKQRTTFEQALLANDYQLRQTLIWVKNRFTFGHSDYHYQHEPILEAQASVPQDETDSGKDHQPVAYGFSPHGEGRLGRGGPHWHGDNAQSTVLECDSPQASKEHPTMKPVKLVLSMLRNSLPPGGLVFDPFAGSGSTLIAALHRPARAYLAELDPKYCDVIAKRWQSITGLIPSIQGRGEHNFL